MFLRFFFPCVIFEWFLSDRDVEETKSKFSCYDWWWWSYRIVMVSLLKRKRVLQLQKRRWEPREEVSWHEREHDKLQSLHSLWQTFHKFIPDSSFHFGFLFITPHSSLREKSVGIPFTTSPTASASNFELVSHCRVHKRKNYASFWEIQWNDTLVMSSEF